MKTTNSQSPVENSQEALLRATLATHAPKSIDLEEGWQTVAQHITALDSRTSPATLLHTLSAKISRKSQRWERWPILATVAALVLVLIGTATGGFFLPWPGGTNNTAYAFDDIYQSRQSQNITITVTKGYADPDRLYIEYNVQLPDSLAKSHWYAVAAGLTQNQYMHVKTFPMVDRSGHVTGAQALMIIGACDDTPQDGRRISCLNIIGGDIEGHLKGPATLGNNGVVKFDVPTMVNTLTFTWDVKEILLTGPSHQHNITIHGNWHLQFSLPFHHQLHDPVLPFPTQNKTILYGFALSPVTSSK